MELESHHSPALYYYYYYYYGFAIFYLFSAFHLHFSLAQQPFLNNDQLDCNNNAPATYGHVCNGVETSCDTFLIFRSDPPSYDTAVGIGYLLNSDPKRIAEINGFTDVQKIPKDTQVIVPVKCSCAGRYYQHNSTYLMKSDDENYYIIANLTYQGLTTCRALMSQNIYDGLELQVGMTFTVPLRCACPTRNQTAMGVKLLLTYLIRMGDTISLIAARFNADRQSIYDANELKSPIVFPFNTLLVPLKRDPTRNQTIIPPPPSEAPTPVAAPLERKRSRTKLTAIGIGVGTLVLLFCGLLVWCFCRRRLGQISNPGEKIEDCTAGSAALKKAKGSNSTRKFPNSAIRDAVDSLTLYAFAELEKATGAFSEDCRIKGCVYRGLINGYAAAVKRIAGDVSQEINIMKQITHSRVIRLSGFCLHEGHTYLVYEFAENGSLRDWLHGHGINHPPNRHLTWKQRVEIALDIADGLNYLHNYANPPCIHKDMKSSNALLDSNMRAKVSNFGLARRMEEDSAQLTRHVVGTQGYMAPEYLENGLVTTKIDVFAFGVVMLELLSGRDAVLSCCATSSTPAGGNGEDTAAHAFLSSSIRTVLLGEGVRERLKAFMDPCLGDDGYSWSSALRFAHLALDCTADDASSRPGMTEVYMTLMNIRSSALDWDSSPGPGSHSLDYGCGR